MRLFPRTPMTVMALAPLALAGAVAGPAAGAAAATATDCSAWNGAQPVRPAAFSPLNGIAAVSPCDGWAVGYQASSLNPNTEQPLIEHWTGSSWTTAPISISPGSLSSVSAVAASDVWAAGDTPDGGLVLHYDGTGWTRTPTPHDSDRTHLLAVDGRTASDAWAGGYIGIGPGAGPVHVMMMRWDGTNWTPSPLPADVSGDGFEVFSVSADSATDAWAVAKDPLTTSSALLHWNGSQWTSSTVNGPAGAVFSSVTALSPARRLGGGLLLRTRRPHADADRALRPHQLERGPQPQPRRHRPDQRAEGRDRDLRQRHLGSRPLHRGLTVHPVRDALERRFVERDLPPGKRRSGHRHLPRIGQRRRARPGLDLRVFRLRHQRAIQPVRRSGSGGPGRNWTAGQRGELRPDRGRPDQHPERRHQLLSIPLWPGPQHRSGGGPAGVVRPGG